MLAVEGRVRILVIESMTSLGREPALQEAVILFR